MTARRIVHSRPTSEQIGARASRTGQHSICSAWLSSMQDSRKPETRCNRGRWQRTAVVHLPQSAASPANTLCGRDSGSYQRYPCCGKAVTRLTTCRALAGSRDRPCCRTHLKWNKTCEIRALHTEPYPARALTDEGDVTTHPTSQRLQCRGPVA